MGLLNWSGQNSQQNDTAKSDDQNHIHFINSSFSRVVELFRGLFIQFSHSEKSEFIKILAGQWDANECNFV